MQHIRDVQTHGNRPDRWLIPDAVKLRRCDAYGCPFAAAWGEAMTVLLIVLSMIVPIALFAYLETWMGNPKSAERERRITGEALTQLAGTRGWRFEIIQATEQQLREDANADFGMARPPQWRMTGKTQARSDGSTAIWTLTYHRRVSDTNYQAMPCAHLHWVCKGIATEAMAFAITGRRVLVEGTRTDWFATRPGRLVRLEKFYDSPQFPQYRDEQMRPEADLLTSGLRMHPRSAMLAKRWGVAARDVHVASKVLCAEVIRKLEELSRVRKGTSLDANTWIDLGPEGLSIRLPVEYDEPLPERFALVADLGLVIAASLAAPDKPPGDIDEGPVAFSRDPPERGRAGPGYAHRILP